MILPFDELNNVQRKLDEEAVISTEGGVKRYDPKKACDIILDYLIYCYAMGIDNANEMLFTSIKGNADEMREVIYKRIEGKTFEDRVREYAEESEDASSSAENPPRGGETERDEEVAAEDGRRPQGGSGETSGRRPTAPTSPSAPGGGSGTALPETDVSDVSEEGTGGDIIRVARTEAHRIVNEAAYLAAKKAGANFKTWECMMLPESRDSHIDLNEMTVGIDDYFVTIYGNSGLYPGDFDDAYEDVNCLCMLSFSF